MPKGRSGILRISLPRVRQFVNDFEIDGSRSLSAACGFFSILVTRSGHEILWLLTSAISPPFSPYRAALACFTAAERLTFLSDDLPAQRNAFYRRNGSVSRVVGHRVPNRILNLSQPLVPVVTLLVFLLPCKYFSTGYLLLIIKHIIQTRASIVWIY